MLKIHRSRTSEYGSPLFDVAAKAPAPLDLATLLRLLRRNRRLIGLVALVTTTFGLVYALTATPLYLASSQVLIDARRIRVDPGAGSSNLSLADLGMDPASVDSQVEVLRSEHVAADVVRQLKLAGDPGFSAPTTLPGRLAALFRRGADTSGTGREGVNAELLELFAKRLDVRRLQQTYVIGVSFYDPSPERAAAIVNAVTGAYLKSQLQANSEAVQHTSAWLKQRIGEVRAEATAADQAVQRFKAENGILDSGTGPLVSQEQLTELSSTLVKARAETAQMEAREAHLRRVIDSRDPSTGIDASFANDTLNRLRDQYASASRREAEIVRKFSPDHVTAQGLRSEMRETNRLILDELRRAADASAGNLAIARAREASLESSFATMGGKTGTTNTAQVTLRSLERDFDGLKTLYQALVARYNAALQQQSFPVSEARILAEARPPQRKSQPNLPLILVLSALGGIAASSAAAVMRDLGDKTFRLPSQIMQSLDLPVLGVLPDLRRSSSPRGWLAAASRRGAPAARGASLLDHATRNPASAFTETLHSVTAEIDARTYHEEGRIVGVVSTLAGEGTSTVAANLAGLAAQTGRRVALIDARGRADGPIAASLPTASPHEGLPHEQAGSFDVLRLGRDHDAMRGSGDVFSTLARTYDYVFVDLPPLSPGAQVRALAPLIGSFVLVVAWGRTDRSAAAEALRAIPLVHERTVGALLNRTDMRAFRLASQGSGDAYYATTTAPAHA